ncbi:MAG: MlaD family protein [Pirellulaceae bacterium]
MNDPYRLRYTNQLVGAFLLVLLLFLLILSILIFQTNDYFVEKHLYWIEVAQQDVEGLQKGSEVLILGERAGVVESIRYVDGTSNVRVNLAIRPEFSSEIFASSSVALERRFGVGAPLLIVRRGLPEDGVLKPLPPGSRIKNFQGEEDRLDQLAREVQSVSESISKIQIELSPTLDQISSSARTFENRVEGNATPAFNKMGAASDEFAETNQTLRPQATQTMLQIQQTTNNLDQRITALTLRIDELPDRISDTSDDVTVAAAKVGNTTEDAGADFANTMSEVRETANEVERLADEARQVVKSFNAKAKICRARSSNSTRPWTTRKTWLEKSVAIRC